MALTRRALKAMGIEDEKIDEIISMHSETVDGLKADVSKYKTDAEKLPAVQKELDDLKASGGDWEQKYTNVKKEFDAYKAAQAGKEAKEAKESAYRSLLKATGVDEKRIEAVMKVSNLDDLEMDGDKLKNQDSIAENIKTEWADFISGEPGVKVNTGGKIGGGNPVTKESIMKIKDASQRQKAIAENIELFREG